MSLLLQLALAGKYLKPALVSALPLNLTIYQEPAKNAPQTNPGMERLVYLIALTVMSIILAVKFVSETLVPTEKSGWDTSVSGQIIAPEDKSNKALLVSAQLDKSGALIYLNVSLLPPAPHDKL